MHLVAADRLGALQDEVREVALSQIDTLQAMISVLETAQRSLPRVSLADLERMRRGRRGSRTAYLLGRLEAAIVDLEDLADNIALEFGDLLDEAVYLKLTSMDFQSIEGAIRRANG